MNRIKVVLLALALMMTASLVRADVVGGLFHNSYISSASVFTGAGTLYRVEMSTGNGTDFAVLYDTVAHQPAGGTTRTAFMVSTQTVTPQLVFYATSTLSGMNSINGRDWQPHGIRITNGLYLYMSAVSNQVAIYWKRDRP